MQLKNITVDDDNVSTRHKAASVLNELNALGSSFGIKGARKQIYTLCASTKGLYKCTNEYNEVVLLQAIEELIVEIYQQNGYILVKYYDETGACTGECMEGRWK